LQEKQYEYFIPYSISGGEIQKIDLDCSQASMMIYLQNTENGTLGIVIPRTLLDSKLGDKDEYIFALVDGYEVDYKETKSSDSRALDISFPLNTQKIEILVSYVFGPGGPPHPKIDCGAAGNEDSIYYHLMSPLKQFKSEIPVDEIQCKENLVLMQNRNGSPACVKPESIPKLIERGWALQTELSIDSAGVGYKDSKCNALDELNFEVFHCPAIAAPTKMTMIQVTGLNICKKENEDVGYTLKPGESGVFTYTVYRGMDTNWPPAEPEYKEILVEPLFLHEIPWEQGMSRRQFVPEGIDVEYQSDLPKLGFNQTATINVNVSVEPNTPRQVMWLGLPPFTCNGGAYVKFAIVE